MNLIGTKPLVNALFVNDVSCRDINRVFATSAVDVSKHATMSLMSNPINDADRC